MPLIRSGRCDECRRRKRKCDEARPRCSGCEDRGVECSYSNQVSKFIHLGRAESGSLEIDGTITSTSQSQTPKENGVILVIRASKEPPAGNGRFHTFRPLDAVTKERVWLSRKQPDRKLQSPSPPLRGDNYKLQCEFGSVLCSASSAGMRLRILGRWIEECLVRVGRCHVLDQAIACLVKGHSARYTMDHTALLTSRQRYSEALSSLRETVSLGAKRITGEIIAATKILMLYELMAGTELTAWINHSFGSIHLLLAVGPQFCERGEFERLLFHSTYAQAWQQALMTNKPSVFDRDEWLKLTPALSQEGDEWTSQRCYVLTKLGRLTYLVRRVRENPKDQTTSRKAASLAEELLNIDWAINEVRGLDFKTVPTKRPDDAELVPMSFVWSDDDLPNVAGLNLIWSSKIMLSGLCQSLHACGAPIKRPSLPELYAEERRCAMSIAMSTDYFASMAPYACMIAVQYLQHAWGVYWRQEAMFDHDDDGMAEWMRRRGNEFLNRINGDKMQSAGLAMYTEMLMGGSCPHPHVEEMRETESPADDESLSN